MVQLEEKVIANFQRDVNAHGATLYRHLCEVVGASVDSKDPKALELLE